jgi:hypothetical protein
MTHTFLFSLLLSLLLSLEMMAQKNLTIDTLVVHDTIRYQEYSVEFTTIFARLKTTLYSNYAVYDSVYYPPALSQTFVLKKGGKILNYVYPPTPKFRHTITEGLFIDIIKSSYTEVYFFSSNNQLFIDIQAYGCNGAQCPVIYLIYDSNGHLVAFDYLVNYGSFQYQQDKEKDLMQNKYELLQKSYIKPYDK